MSAPSSPAGGGPGTPLQPLSHNAQRESSMFSTLQQQRGVAAAGSAAPRDSSVHEKINQFNSLAMQSKQLERKTADAALKRAILGREEAEAEMRRYRDEVMKLRKLIEEGKDRERRVGERLEAVMENYGRAKETHAHTQQLWEKEIRRTRKEAFKAQSALVKMQEELKSCRTAQKAAEEELQSERERGKAREQEAFSAQYKLVGLQEQLDQALERVKMLEQERDALKTFVENQQEVRRISSESKHPFALSEAGMEEDETDEETPRKRQRMSADDADVEALRLMWQWEKQRADRALEQVQFLEVECQLKICPTGKSLRRRSARVTSSPRGKRSSLLRVADAGDAMILGENPLTTSESTKSSLKRSKTDMLREDKEPRRSTIFVPEEGIFRTVSQAEADAAVMKSASSGVSPTEATGSLLHTPTDSDPHYRRTPSVDPPDFAMLTGERTSLLSLLEAPHRQSGPSPIFNIPTTPGPDPVEAQNQPHSEPVSEPEPLEEQPAPSTRPPPTITQTTIIPPPDLVSAPLTDPLPSRITTTFTQDENARPDPAAYHRPHTSTSHYHHPVTTTVTTTTKVPLREETKDPNLAQRLMKMQRAAIATPLARPHNNNNTLPTTPANRGEEDADVLGGTGPSFDVTNPALTPTMTREEALAQIRERRGRARSTGRGPNTQAAAGGGVPGNGAGTARGVSVSRNGSGSGNGNGTVRRAAGGGGGAGGDGADNNNLKKTTAMPGHGTTGADKDRARGRERDRRDVSAPSTGAARGAAVVRGVSARRVRS